MKWLTLASLVGAVSSLTGCFLTDESPGKKAFAQLGAFQSDCLREFPRNVSDYFQGKLQDDVKIAATWDCAASSLREVKKLVRGDRPEELGARDVQSFFNRYLRPEDRVSDVLLDEAMKLKAGAINGSQERITYAEIDRTIELLGLLKQHSLDLKILMPINPEHVGSLSVTQLERGIRAVESVASALGGFLGDRGAPYALDDAYRLLLEFERIKGLRWLREQMPALRVAKSIVMGGSSDEIRHEEWPKFLEIGSKFAGFALFFSSQKARCAQNWFSDAGVEALAALFDRGVDLLAAAERVRGSDVVPAERIRAWVGALKELKAGAEPSSVSVLATTKMADLTAKAILAKQVLLGGRPYEIDLSRIARLRPFIRLVKEPALRLVRLLRTPAVASLSEPEFNGLLLEVDAAAATFAYAVGGLRDDSDGVELFSTFLELLREVAPLFEKDGMQARIDDGLALLRGSKGLLLGAPHEGIGPRQWGPVVEQGARLARLYLISLRRPEERPERGWELLDEGADLLLASARMREEGAALPVSDVLTLLTSLPVRGPSKIGAIKELIPEVMELKRALVGGDAQGVTLAELQRLQKLVNQLRAEARFLAPLLPMELAEIAGWSTERVDGLAKALNSSGERLASAIDSRFSASYSWDELDALLRKAAPLMKSDQLLSRARELLPALASAKAVILRPPHDRIGAAEWPSAFSSTGAWAGLALQGYHFARSGQAWDRGPGLARFVELGDLTLERLRFSAAGHPGKVIAFADLERLTDSVYDVASRHGVVPPMRLATAKGFLRPGANRLLAGADFSEAGRRAPGLTSRMLDLTRERLERWGRNQRALEQTFLTLGGGVEGLVSDGYPQWMLLQEFSRRTNFDLKDLVLMFRPLFLGQDSHFSYVYEGTREYLYSFHDLSWKNLFHPLVRAFIEGYADDPPRAVLGQAVTGKELERFVVDVHDLIHDFKFGSQAISDEKLAKQRFLEANVFTSRANGDRYFELAEGIEYMGFLASTKAIASPVFSDMLENCSWSGVDLFGRPKVKMPCFRGRFFDKARFRQRLGRALPRMVAAYENLDDAGRDAFRVSLERSARMGKYTDDPIDAFEAENFVMLMSYVESLFMRYDEDASGRLTIPEALGAFPIICPKLKEVSGLKGTCRPRWGQLEGLFGYMLVHGATPKKPGNGFLDKIGAGAKFLVWLVEWSEVRKSTDAKYLVDRPRILSVIEAMATAGSSSDE